MLPCCEGLVDQLQDWQGEGSCLATACLGGSHDIAASQDKRDAFRLYWCGAACQAQPFQAYLAFQEQDAFLRLAKSWSCRVH